MSSKPPRIGRRQRSLRRVAVLVALTALVAAVVVFVVYRLTRPQPHRPGEELEDITSRLSLDLPPTAPEPRFQDLTEVAGLAGFDLFAGERTSQLPEDMGAGLAWGDFDNDGDDDLFLVSAGGALNRPEGDLAPSELYENLGDGTFRRFPGFPETRIRGMGAAWGDYDGDGRLDLVVSGFGSLTLYSNRGDSFVPDPRLDAPEGYWSGVAWGDFDADRDLDLYVGGYVRYDADPGEVSDSTDQYGKAVPYTLNPASFEPERNLLFVNRLREPDVAGFTEEALIRGVANPGGRSLSVLWHDFDADGRLDLYVANDISDNALFLNRGDSFEDAGLAAWVADYRGAMGLAAGDWNRDGDDDLFVTHWIAQENALYDSRLLQMPQRLTFSDMAAPLGLGQPALQRIGWGTEFCDLDADGWLDLPVINGSTFEEPRPSRRLESQAPFLFWNEAGKGFHDLAPLSPVLSQPTVGRGLAVGDFDGDGDLDLASTHLDGGVRLLANEMERGNVLQLRLRSLGPDGRPVGFAEGAVAIVRVGEVALRRTVGGASYLSQSTRTLHFGLGDAQEVDAVEVIWPGGERASYPGLPAGGVWELVEGDPEPRRLAGGESEAERRARIQRFWNVQREAMHKMKVEGDVEGAAELFTEALTLNPDHQDSRYYLANCLAAMERIPEALAQFQELARRNPASSRAHRQRGALLATHADSDADLAEAERALEQALEINREETGALQILGELALLRGHLEVARQRFEWVNQANSTAVGALFFRAYLEWKGGSEEEARKLLEAAVAAGGPDWKPAGATAEGDVAGKMHQESGPLAGLWQSWSGETDPEEAFEPVDAFLRQRG